MTNEKIEKKSWKTIIVLAVIALPLAIAFWAHIAGSYVAAKDFFYADTVTADLLKTVFTALMWLIFTIITLFTPTKALKSPLSYIAETIANKWDGLKNMKDEPEKKKTIYLEIWINTIYLVILTASYFYIIKNIVKYNDNYTMDQSSWVLTVLLFWVVIAVFLALTSFMVWKLQEIDDSWESEDAKQQTRTMWSIAMIVWVLTSLAIGNGLINYIDNYVQEKGEWVIKDVYDNLGWSKENLWDGGVFDFDK